MAKKNFYIQTGTTSAGGYDIYRRKGKVGEDGELEDYRVATIYDADSIDMFLQILDMEDLVDYQAFATEETVEEPDAEEYFDDVKG